MVSVSPAAVRMSYPDASRWQESRHTPRRLPPPAASSSSASSSKERPSVPPAPAVSSRCSGQRSVSDSASLITLPARLIALPTSPCLADPGCRTTPAAPIPSPTRSDWISEARDLSRISASSEAQLSRYTAWISTALIAAGVDRLAELGEVVVGVGGGSPHPRGLVEDLDRLAAALDAALDRASSDRPRSIRGRRLAWC